MIQWKPLFTVALSAVLLLVAGGCADTTDKWRMASAFGSQLALLGEAGVRLTEEIERKSDGALRLEFLEPGASVPATEVIDAVRAGSFEAGYTTAAYAVGRNPALHFFTAVPFGAFGLTQYDWVRVGEGRVLHDEFFATLGVKAIPCGYIGPEGGGWFKRPIHEPADLKGIKMRFFGLGAQVMEKFGVSTQLLAGADIYPALERGDIDAAELSAPYVDIDFGFHRVAKFYYYPGLHQRASLLELVINPKAWDDAGPAINRLIEEVCHETILWAHAEDKTRAPAAITALRSMGVTVGPLDPSIVEAAARAWLEVAQEQAEKNSDFARTLAAYRRFLKANPIAPAS